MAKCQERVQLVRQPSNVSRNKREGRGTILGRLSQNFVVAVAAAAAAAAAAALLQVVSTAFILGVMITSAAA